MSKTAVKSLSRIIADGMRDSDILPEMVEHVAATEVAKVWTDVASGGWTLCMELSLVVAWVAYDCGVPFEATSSSGGLPTMAPEVSSDIVIMDGLPLGVAIIPGKNNQLYSSCSLPSSPELKPEKEEVQS
ncbi:hypothetical protein KI387_025210, partial [Taxus chinensis]